MTAVGGCPLGSRSGGHNKALILTAFPTATTQRHKCATSKGGQQTVLVEMTVPLRRRWQGSENTVEVMTRRRQPQWSALFDSMVVRPMAARLAAQALATKVCFFQKGPETNDMIS